MITFAVAGVGSEHTSHSFKLKYWKSNHPISKKKGVDKTPKPCYNTDTKKRKEMIIMKKANELKVIAIAEAERKEVERREKSIGYLENRIFPEMEKASAEGRLYTEYYVDAWVDMKVVTDELTANGYTHSKNGRNLKIYWM